MHLIIDIWGSFRRLPTWVQLWMVVVLIPVNLAPLLVLDQPLGGWIAALAVMGMALNLPIVFRDRGFGKAMALPHVALWTPAVLLALWVLTGAQPIPSRYQWFLILLVVVDVISLAFDVRDARAWLRGDRTVA